MSTWVATHRSLSQPFSKQQSLLFLHDLLSASELSQFSSHSLVCTHSGLRNMWTGRTLRAGGETPSCSSPQGPDRTGFMMTVSQKHAEQINNNNNNKKTQQIICVLPAIPACVWAVRGCEKVGLYVSVSGCVSDFIDAGCGGVGVMGSSHPVT